MNPIAWLLGTEDFPARFNCCTPGSEAWASLGWWAIAGELLISAAYVVLPVLLLRAMRQRERTRGDVPADAHRLVLLGAAFVLSCGIGHALDAMMFVWPAYRLLTVWHWVTAVVSVATACAAPAVLARLVELPSAREVLGLRDRADIERERVVAALALANEELARISIEALSEPLSDMASTVQIENRLEALRRDRMAVIESERASAEKHKRTRERVRMLEKVIDLVGFSLIWKHWDGRVLLVNDEALKLSPIASPNAEDVEGVDAAESWDPVEAAGFLADDRRVITSGARERYAETVTTSRGVRVLATDACPVPGENAVLKGTIDVTEIWRDIARLATENGL